MLSHGAGGLLATGKELLAREMAAEGWGAKMVLRLAADLKEKFPEARGYSPRYLRYMKSFAEALPDLQMLQRPLALAQRADNLAAGGQKLMALDTLYLRKYLQRVRAEQP